uniref:G_PROTEIN_RECEP_F1_2 domain-containing protein n=1 Tax=Panagrellus redivivus TaxID=6233 RepID=A0A7E4UU21_PANRE
MIVTSQFTQLCYRVAVTYAPGVWCHDVSKKLVNLYVINGCATLILGTLTVIPAIINIHDPFEAQQLFVDDFPALLPLAKEHPYLTGYHPDKNDITISMLYYYGMIFAGGVFPVIAVVSLFFFGRHGRDFEAIAVIFFVPVQIFYRYLIIVRDVVITNKRYVIMLIPSFITVLPISGGYYATISLTPGCTSDIIEKLKLSNDGHDLACVPLVLTHPAMIVLLSMALTGMTVCFIFVPFVSYLVYKNLRNKTSMTFSEKSVQRQVGWTLILQVCIIAITSLFPLGCILINMVLTTSLPWLSTIASATFSILPVVNPILTMCTIRAYRRVLSITVRKVCEN